MKSRVAKEVIFTCNTMGVFTGSNCWIIVTEVGELCTLGVLICWGVYGQRDVY